ncbi:MAG: hypothetical protein A2655_02880 [Candidatus Yanofskybacteria bacterium RIFCSPHIGHO2_01_FULL_43_42]|uniref:Uncharacterized protein n=1 Tax=Candidatus Yanofskybacteria bacterium RIFCSPLOWO2_01_FULL_43_22 TaxID=1802695 RepID=A0A1F8GGZ0_9BACT|nr:MAG: hypothetical protein A2655_02880 [Candidatus Yanofskybacteria bacterium RIFCSPHIGHO2_01_FULL_43_42]OGN12953.1 MAG: hypothetical protein A3D48_03540 [Candidatus Yanofskybacteria bacterium RIFCSPHIGHO2_02_FULL_43_17]OGN23966.1 MAG: hypothetical protein A3A13_02715 [Candidatus Yanofskybacteria bacterium RIFCSPLOWO2_01_FULL_43_22]
MSTVEKLKPSTTEKPKPEKPADISDFESVKKKKRLWEARRADTSSVLADALELVRESQLSDAEIDELRSITNDEKTLLKTVSDLFTRLRNNNQEIEELRELIGQIKQKLGEE